jgi:hypothetical protein
MATMKKYANDPYLNEPPLPPHSARLLAKEFPPPAPSKPLPNRKIRPKININNKYESDVSNTEYIEYLKSDKQILDENERDEIIMHCMPAIFKNQPLTKKYKEMISKLRAIDIKPQGFNELYKDILHNLNVLGIGNTTPHTIFFIDDCIDLVSKRGVLFKKLFENRQGKITYFLGLQDVHGIPSSMKSNMDSLVFFGGFSKQKYNSLFYQIPTDIQNREDLYHDYKRLKKGDCIMFSFEADGVKSYIYKK